MSRPVAPFALVAFAAVASLLTAGFLISQSAQALPPAGEDVFVVAATVEVESRLGQETFNVTGTANIRRSAPRMEGGVEVQDLTIQALQLQGSITAGPVAVSHSETRTSVGEVRSKSSGVEFPASSYLDIFFDADVPASPLPTNPVTLHNETAIRLVPTTGTINTWPPVGVTYAADLDPCLPLFPTDPAEVCLNALSVTLLEAAPGNPTFSVAPGGPSVFHPGDLLSSMLALPPTPTPSSTSTPGGPTATPTLTPTPPVGNVAGNDDFDDAHLIAEIPFGGVQDTSDMTIEPNEPLTEDANDPLNLQCFFPLTGVIGNTVWFQFTPASSKTLRVDTFNSLFDTVLAVYTGNDFTDLDVVDCTDDPDTAGPPPHGVQARVIINVTAGTTYYIQVGGFGSVGDDLILAVTEEGAAGSSGAAAGVAPSAAIGCAALGLTADGCDEDATQDNVDAVSYGSDFTVSGNDLVFSVAAGSLGLPGSGVAGQSGCTPAEPQADQFATHLDGTNTLLFDGDGVGEGCPTAAALGLVEGDPSDDLDAVTGQPPSAVDTDEDGTPDAPVFFSLEADSPSLTAFGLGAADVLYSMNGNEPLVFATAAELGLQAGDDIDALCLDNGGGGLTFSPAGDTLYFSLAAGSPTLTDLGASAADILGPGATVVHEAATLGLQEGDDVDALDCFIEPPPTPTPTITSTPTRTPTPVSLTGSGDVNKDGTTNAVDATILLQFAAGLVTTIHVDGDVNRDGRFTSVDATLILQYIADLIPALPV